MTHYKMNYLSFNWLRPGDAYMLSKLAAIGSDNGLSPGRRQAIIWTKVGLLLIGLLGTNFNEISSEIIIFSFKTIRLNVSSAKWRPFCLGLNVLMVAKCSCSVGNTTGVLATTHFHLQYVISMQLSSSFRHYMIHISRNRKIKTNICGW